MWQCEPQPKARRVDECGSASRNRRRGESMNDERGEIAVKLRVGVFVLVALAAFLGMVYALGARARLFEAHYTIHAEFTEVAGLTEGATVRLAGVQIGRVTDVHLPGEPGGKVRVDLTIARRYADRIRRDSIARIETQGLLGDKVVEVTVGTAAAPRACFSRPRGRTPHGGSSGRWIGSDAWSTDPGPTRASSRHSSSNRSIRRRSRTFALSRVTSATCPTGSPAGGARSALSSPTGTPAACARSFRTCGSRWRTSRRSAKRSRRARGRSARSSRIRRSTSGS